MFIKRLELSSDLDQVIDTLNTVVDSEGWGHTNQICLKSRPGAENKWFDGAGSLFDREKSTKLATEADFTEWNLDEDNYLRQQIELLERTHGFKAGRVRFMRLLPHYGLSVHKDLEVRYHLVLKTHFKAYIAHHVVETNLERSVLPSRAICYHIPADGSWYEVDTKEAHWVYNGSEEDRIHLVVSGEH